MTLLRNYDTVPARGVAWSNGWLDCGKRSPAGFVHRQMFRTPIDAPIYMGAIADPFSLIVIADR